MQEVHRCYLLNENLKNLKMEIPITLHCHPVELRKLGVCCPFDQYWEELELTSIVNAVKNARSSAATRDAAKAAEELAKFTLASEQKTGSGLTFKRNK